MMPTRILRSSTGIPFWKKAAFLIATILLSASLGGALSGCNPPAGPEDFEATIRAGEGLGDRVRLEALRGHVVVLDFWAHWCEPCFESAPAMNRLHERFGNRGVAFYGVNTEANLSPRRLIEEHARLGAVFPTFHDQDGTLGKLYQVSSLPTLIILDRNGRISSRHYGLVNEQRVESAIEQALAKN